MRFYIILIFISVLSLISCDGNRDNSSNSSSSESIATKTSSAIVAKAKHYSEEETSTLENILKLMRCECDIEKSWEQTEWTSYLSPSECTRLKLLKAIPKLKDFKKELVVDEIKNATGEYREMLFLMLAIVGDNAAYEETKTLLLESKYPSVRILSGMSLRMLNKKDSIDCLKKALNDSFRRADGSCTSQGRLIYPVRLVASDALVTLGFPFEKVRKLRGY